MRRHALGAAVSIALLTSAARGQVLNNIPVCYQNCIKNAGDFTCNGIDISCICRLSGGNFLPSVIECIKSTCDSNLNSNNLLGPLQVGCNLVGVPISSSIISNAEAQITSTRATTRRTQTGQYTMTTTFASAGTTFVAVVPESVRSGRFGLETSSGTPSMSVFTPTATGNTGSFDIGTEIPSLKTNTGSASSFLSPTKGTSKTTIGSSITTTYSSTTTETSTSTSTSTTESTTSTDATANGGATANSFLPGNSPVPSPINGGSPFSNSGDSLRPIGGRWLALGMGLLAGAAWL
ncbi:MAG: hypothetical protein M1832_004809 [Thelocarpon impressellum]|nr:MAG: hypothetical protein M1832_004809 [Thelocarpon impressellum]